MNKTIQKISFIAILAAFLCVLSPWSIPIGDIPVTLATFALYLIGGLTKKFDGLLVVLVYIFIGIIGIPVFSSFRGGIGVVLGATGGYIIGYLPAVIIISFLTCINKKQFFWYPLSMVLGTIICYFVGTIWYMFQTENSLAYALTVCVVPFIIFDIIKIIVASIVAYIINVKTTLFSSIYSGINKNMIKVWKITQVVEEDGFENH